MIVDNPPWKPRIYRTWDSRLGRQCWRCTSPPRRWGLGSTLRERELEMEAIRFCIMLNRRESDHGA